MNQSAQLAKHLRELHFGDNWTSSSLKQQVSDLTWLQATTKAGPFHTIAALVFHIHYYIDAVMGVLKGAPLTARDKFSFDHPPIRSHEDWNRLLEKTWSDAEACASTMETFPDNCLQEVFVEEKYGTYYRNLLGIIEHAHYHLGQIVLIRKMVLELEGGNVKR